MDNDGPVLSHRAIVLRLYLSCSPRAAVDLYLSIHTWSHLNTS